MSTLGKSSVLKLIVGSMFSGKTTALIREIERHSVVTSDILIINHSLDSQRTHCLSVIETHCGEKRDAVSLTRLSDVLTMEQYASSEVVAIDEGQFFEDLDTFLEAELERTDKTFIVAGLNGDFRKRPFGKMLQLVPLADEIEKLSAYCTLCRDSTPAHFTRRIAQTSQQVLVGRKELYIPVCRRHHRQ